MTADMKQSKMNLETAAEEESCDLDGALLMRMLRAGARNLRLRAETINQLNIFPVPDGDTGDNMSMTAESGVRNLPDAAEPSLSEVMTAFARGTLLGARGNSGVILSQFFSGIADGCRERVGIGAAALSEALKKGVEKAYAAVMKPTEGTILTVAREGVSAAAENRTDGERIDALLAKLIEGMRTSLAHTPEKLAALREAGVVDSGGAGLLAFMEGFGSVLLGEGECGEALPEPLASASVEKEPSSADTGMPYGYCTELLIDCTDEKTDRDLSELSAFLNRIGESVVLVGSEGMIKLHVHTFSPGEVLTFCQRYGAFRLVKIENMSLQHRDTLKQESVKRTPKHRCALIAVAPGDGIADVFRSLGVDQIVSGGQTSNPSAADFLSAFEAADARQILVLPNNGNIVLAAGQAAQLWDQGEVHVLPACDPGAGYAALSVYDPDAPDLGQMREEMEKAIRRTVTGSLAPAVRDAELSGLHITSGDCLGMIGKEPVLSCPDLAEASIGLLRNLMERGNHSVLTFFTGEGFTKEAENKLSAFAAAAYPDTELYWINGGQKLCPLLISAD